MLQIWWQKGNGSFLFHIDIVLYAKYLEYKHHIPHMFELVRVIFPIVFV